MKIHSHFWDVCAWTQPKHKVFKKSTKFGIGRCLVELVPGRKLWPDVKGEDSARRQGISMFKFIRFVGTPRVGSGGRLPNEGPAGAGCRVYPGLAVGRLVNI